MFKNFSIVITFNITENVKLIALRQLISSIHFLAGIA